uniref:U8 snoRNA-decapping enzyme-like n=1 Tax=Phallusia mammillata TaxID=59560 RepID=A0A6F9DN78_9ASCI|nr:U8 snoRNA-decapping enzyme-like [Phallusia mammillata]
MEHAVMMQLRFDGTLGFPGGYVNYHENITKGLNRELEEIALKQRNFFSDRDYYGTWIHSYMSTPLVDHFYVKEFTEDEFKKIEMQTLKAQDWGGETMGIIRVPLDCLPLTDKPYGPMPHFLLHNFVGNAREQLVKTIVEKQLVNVEDMQHAWAKMIELKHRRDKT